MTAVDSQLIAGESNIPVSVIIATRNEEMNLPACLASLARMDQVFVVDSQSTDGTCEIAREHGAEVVHFRYDGGWPKKRNWALRNLPIRNDWVLILDADERVSVELAAEIAEAIGNPNYHGYYMRWKFVFLGRWMKHCWRHGWMLRLFRRGKAEYEDLGLRTEGNWDAEVHENIVLHGGETGKLNAWLHHESEENLGYWIAKQNEFSSWNAARRAGQLKETVPDFHAAGFTDPLQRRRWLKSIFIRMPMRPLLVFLWLYVVRLGFLDGREGYYFCRLRAIHEFITTVKIYERESGKLRS